MKLVHLSVLIAVLLFHGPASHAQSKGWVRFQVVPMKELLVRVNGELQSLGTSGVNLEPGAYRFAFHAPDRAIWDTTVQVVADSTIQLRKVLRVSDEHVAFLLGTRKAKRSKLFLKGGGVLAVAVCGGLWYAADKDRRDVAQRVSESGDAYSQFKDPVELSEWRFNTVPELLAEQDKLVGRTYLWGGLTAVSASLVYLGFRKAAKVALPEYQDRERVRFNGLSWTPGRTGGVFASIMITW